MGKRKKKANRPPSKRAAIVVEPTESRSADVLTVAWCLTVFTAFLCDLATAGLWIFLRNHPEHRPLVLLAALLYFAALVTGSLAVGLLPLVYRLRKEPPPRGVVVFAILVGIAPWIALACHLAMR